MRKEIADAQSDFIASMDDDFNVQNALTVMYDLVTKINSHLQQEKVDKDALANFTSLLQDWLLIFGVSFGKQEDNNDQEIEELINKRNLARQNKDWATSDQLRDQLKNMGIVIEDTAQGTRWYRA